MKRRRMLRTITDRDGIFKRLCTGAVIGGRGENGDRLTEPHYVPHEEFAEDTDNEIDGLQHWCMKCMNEYAAEYKRRTGDGYVFKSKIEDE